MRLFGVLFLKNAPFWRFILGECAPFWRFISEECAFLAFYF